MCVCAYIYIHSDVCVCMYRIVIQIYVRVCTYVCTHKLTHLHTGCRELSSRNLDVLKPPALKMGLNAFTECMDE